MTFCQSPALVPVPKRQVPRKMVRISRSKATSRGCCDFGDAAANMMCEMCEMCDV